MDPVKPNGLGFVGTSRAMQQVYHAIDNLGLLPYDVHVSGETGTGKYLVALALHTLGRNGNPFLHVNCAAIPSELFESEMFGHAKGSFTGANRGKEGYLTAAGEGTVLLDEIVSLDPSHQAKLLVAKDQRTFTRVGETRGKKYNARIVTASNGNLSEMRKDLVYRLGPLRIDIPPLRERMDDLEMLVHFFVQQYNAENEASYEGVSQEVLDHLAGYSWPGNVRQLSNVVTRACAKGGSRGFLQADDFETLAETEQREGEYFSEALTTRTWRELEAEQILTMLLETKGNKSKTARRLDLAHRTLRNKLKTIPEQHPELWEAFLERGGEFIIK